MGQVQIPEVPIIVDDGSALRVGHIWLSRGEKLNKKSGLVTQVAPDAEHCKAGHDSQVNG